MAVLLALVIGDLGAVASPARGSDQTDTARIDELVDPGSRWAPLGPFVVDLGPRRAQVSDLREANLAAVTAAAAEAAANEGIQRSSAEAAQARLARGRAGAELAVATAQLARRERRLATYAVATYLGGRPGRGVVDPRSAAADPIPVLVEAVGERLVDDQRQSRRRHRAGQDQLAVAVEHQDRIEQALDRYAAERDRAAADRSAAADRAAVLAARLESEMWSAAVTGADFPLVALEAYVGAADRIAAVQPECRVRWWQLAAIGSVESRHGTFAGNRLGPDGRTSGRIVGLALDGNGVAAVPDTDGGRLDGDPVWDRAVGPMQFIPGTWASLGADGDGNGTADPHDLHDAAFAAARLLCRGRAGVDQADQYRSALLAYNRSTAYGASVMAIADRYRSAVAAD